MNTNRDIRTITGILRQCLPYSARRVEHRLGRGDMSIRPAQVTACGVVAISKWRLQGI